MFQRLDELQTGTMYILTGQAGVGKSHLAASARRSGTLWILDTEGAAQSLHGKTGIHKRTQVVQTLSLKALTQAMEEIRKQGKPGDTVLLDSISKIFQAMRSYAQQRAGSETDRKTNIGYDEHVSVNRNMQVVYTGLTELKQAGFHVVIIGHLARKYRAQEGGLSDDGLRVLADEQIAYEADAILLVEREGDERSVMPIVKPPRPAHLKFEQRYPAVLATLYPDLVPTSKARKGEAAADVAETNETTSPESEAAPPTGTGAQPPRDATEAEQRFFARYGDLIGERNWSAVQRYLGSLRPRPTSVEEWIAVAEAVRGRSRGETVVAAGKSRLEPSQRPSAHGRRWLILSSQGN
ncbi:AAA family ATPase [Candidatus Gracilibacteria bacterium]|nr:AAA family ATPase [Candidatus Gracilibacteria bacterium]